MIGFSSAKRTSTESESRATLAPPHSRLTELLGLLIGGRGSDEAPDPSAPLHDRGLGPTLLADVTEIVASLLAGERPRASGRVRISDEPWELGVEWIAGSVSVSLFTGGPLPTVFVHDRRTDPAALRKRLLSALDGVGGRAGAAEARVVYAQSLLRGLAAGERRFADPEPLSIAPHGDDDGFALGAELMLRSADASASSRSPSSVLRADLYALLGRGTLRIHSRGHARDLDGVHVFLVAEQLARLTAEALEAQKNGRSVWRKVQVGGAVVGLRLATRASLPVRAVNAADRSAKRSDEDEDGANHIATVTLGHLPNGRLGRADQWTFPLDDLGTFAESFIAFGRAVARGLVRRDRAFSHNLRLVEFRARLRDIGEQLRARGKANAIVNRAPESYRAFANHLASRPVVGSAGGGSAPVGVGARLRFQPAWTAAVPAIDLKATFLTHTGLLVGSHRELYCIERKTGSIAWRKAVPRAASVLTPCGLARFDADGTLRLHDLDTGDVRWTLRLAPRLGAPVTGAVVGAPGLPRMLILSEGRAFIAGIDLESGEVKWRFTALKPNTFRLKRAGKIVLVSSGEDALTALDVVTGEVVWRACDPLRFASSVTVERDALYAVAGGVGSARAARLHHIDPWSGLPRWSVELPRGIRPVAAPLACEAAVVLVTRAQHGTGVLGFDAKSGAQLFERDACLGAASAIAIDGNIVLNSEAGELAALDAQTGAVRYRHVFAAGVEGDRPRKLDPVLRSGALFVPQTRVHVVRPHDGAILGAVDTELVPDLVRVDEQCNVIVAEESGHVAAFGAGAKLSLVR